MRCRGLLFSRFLANQSGKVFVSGIGSDEFSSLDGFAERV